MRRIEKLELYDNAHSRMYTVYSTHTQLTVLSTKFTVQSIQFTIQSTKYTV